MAQSTIARMSSIWDRLLLRPSVSGAGESTTTSTSTSSSSAATQSSIPVFLYGTAWKKQQTADLVYKALCAGFRGIDTAGQPRHYQENLVGEGIRRALAEGKVKREDIYVSASSLLYNFFFLQYSMFISISPTRNYVG